MPKSDNAHKPILITGCPRSGTTFLGSVFEASKDCFEIYEPFNSDFTYHLALPTRFYRIENRETLEIRRQTDQLVELSTLSGRIKKLPRGAIDRFRAQKDTSSALALKKLVQRTARFISANRVVIKDPVAFFSSAWISKTYGSKVVIMFRHPGGVVSSYLALDWEPETPEIIEHTMPETRARLRDEIARWEAAPEDRVGALILQWKIFTIETMALARANPDWHVVSHEHLCDQPNEVFAELFEAFGLELSAQVKEKIRESTTAENVVDPKKHIQHNLNRSSKTLKNAWKNRLDDETIERIKNEAEPLWKEAVSQFYPEKGLVGAA
ncbi:MAG: sulfotransferase [Pseudomonadota bacterium]